MAADAVGSLTALGHDISLRRMEHEGITVATTATVIAELASDHPTCSKIMRGSAGGMPRTPRIHRDQPSRDKDTIAADQRRRRRPRARPRPDQAQASGEP